MQKNLVVERSDKQFIIQAVAVDGKNEGIDIGFVRTVNRNLMRSYQLYMFALAKGTALLSTLQEADHVVRIGDDAQGQEQYVLFYELEPELYARTAADALDAGSDIEDYNQYVLEPFIACAVDDLEELTDQIKDMNCHTQREIFSAMHSLSHLIITLESETKLVVDARNVSDLEMMMDFTEDYVLDDGRPRTDDETVTIEEDSDKLYHSFDLAFDQIEEDPFEEEQLNVPETADVMAFDGAHVGEQIAEDKEKAQHIEEIAASIAQEMELAASAEEIEMDIVNEIEADEDHFSAEPEDEPEVIEEIGDVVEAEVLPKTSPYWVGIDPSQVLTQEEAEQEEKIQLEDDQDEEEIFFTLDSQLSAEIVEEPEQKKTEPVRDAAGLVLPNNVKGFSVEPAVQPVAEEPVYEEEPVEEKKPPRVVAYRFDYFSDQRKKKQERKITQDPGQTITSAPVIEETQEEPQEIEIVTPEVKEPETPEVIAEAKERNPEEVIVPVTEILMEETVAAPVQVEGPQETEDEEIFEIEVVEEPSSVPEESIPEEETVQPEQKKEEIKPEEEQSGQEMPADEKKKAEAEAKKPKRGRRKNPSRELEVPVMVDKSAREKAQEETQEKKEEEKPVQVAVKEEESGPKQIDMFAQVDELTGIQIREQEEQKRKNRTRRHKDLKLWSSIVQFTEEKAAAKKENEQEEKTAQAPEKETEDNMIVEPAAVETEEEPVREQKETEDTAIEEIITEEITTEDSPAQAETEKPAEETKEDHEVQEEELPIDVPLFYTVDQPDAALEEELDLFEDALSQETAVPAVSTISESERAELEAAIEEEKDAIWRATRQGRVEVTEDGIELFFPDDENDVLADLDKKQEEVAEENMTPEPSEEVSSDEETEPEEDTSKTAEQEEEPQEEPEAAVEDEPAVDGFEEPLQEEAEDEQEEPLIHFVDYTDGDLEIVIPGEYVEDEPEDTPEEEIPELEEAMEEHEEPQETEEATPIHEDQYEIEYEYQVVLEDELTPEEVERIQEEYESTAIEGWEENDWVKEENAFGRSGIENEIEQTSEDEFRKRTQDERFLAESEDLYSRIRVITDLPDLQETIEISDESAQEELNDDGEIEIEVETVEPEEDTPEEEFAEEAEDTIDVTAEEEEAQKQVETELAEGVALEEDSVQEIEQINDSIRQTQIRLEEELERLKEQIDALHRAAQIDENEEDASDAFKEEIPNDTSFEETLVEEPVEEVINGDVSEEEIVEVPEEEIEIEEEPEEAAKDTDVSEEEIIEVPEEEIEIEEEPEEAAEDTEVSEEAIIEVPEEEIEIEEEPEEAAEDTDVSEEEIIEVPEEEIEIEEESEEAAEDTDVSEEEIIEVPEEETEIGEEPEEAAEDTEVSEEEIIEVPEEETEIEEEPEEAAEDTDGSEEEIIEVPEEEIEIEEEPEEATEVTDGSEEEITETPEEEIETDNIGEEEKPGEGLYAEPEEPETDFEDDNDFNQDYLSAIDSIVQEDEEETFSQDDDDENWFDEYLRQTDEITFESEFEHAEPDVLDAEIKKHERMIEEAREERKRLDEMASELDRSIAETAAAAASAAREKVRREKREKKWTAEPEQTEEPKEKTRETRTRQGKNKKWFF